MKVFSLLDFFEFEGSVLLGVFGSLDELKAYVETQLDRRWYDCLAYVESELGAGVALDQAVDLDDL